MSIEKTGKLNRLQRDLPEGLLASAAWLVAKGYSPQLCNKYVASGWLERLAQGVYKRPGGKLVWEQVVISLQALLEFPLVVGGKTALTLQGFAHYLPREVNDVHLYGPKAMPTWLNKLPLQVRFHYHNSETLFRDDPITRGLTHLSWIQKENTSVSADPVHGRFNIMPWGQWDWPLTLSTPERAILELLDDLPEHESFDQADKFMEGLASLSPRRIQKLLADCKSVKVKRLFLFFAARHHHGWLKHLDTAAVNLGTGKRMLARGGKLDQRYLITVPEELHGTK
ncbi:MAG: type IV toxin-antitoxin system AbiEi family antitoxin domain-containing protein [Aestuariivirga sp.]|nr:type IV toxin-antitoxin system AbiEi family antitoxin domain-containing protein [Aestuariivirga sp.]